MNNPADLEELFTWIRGLPIPADKAALAIDRVSELMTKKQADGYRLEEINIGMQRGSQLICGETIQTIPPLAWVRLKRFQYHPAPNASGGETRGNEWHFPFEIILPESA